MKNIEKAFNLKEELDSLRPISSDQEARIMQKFRLDWNYHSNHLEGNSLTYGETKALLMHGLTSQGKPLKDHIEITGHDEAIKWIEEIAKGDFVLTENFIRQLHLLLLKEPYEIDAITLDGKPTKKMVEVGKYKTLPNHVKTNTGEIFYFATPEETPSKMHDLMKWYKSEISNRANSIILAAELHYKFIRIHPFDDGNGRTARILMNLTLMRFGFPPIIIKTQDKNNYFYALSQADAGNIEIFIDYIAKNLVYSLELMISGIKGENIEEFDDIDKEISLLKHQAKNEQKKLQPLKSEETILEVFNQSIVPLFKKFIFHCSKFSDFYKRSYFILGNIRSNKLSEEDSVISEVRKTISNHTDRIGLIYHYQHLVNQSFDDFSFRNQINFEFGSNLYRINFVNKELTKSYDDYLTEDEATEIIKLLKEHHYQRIKSQIKK